MASRSTVLMFVLCRCRISCYDIRTDENRDSISMSHALKRYVARYALSSRTPDTNCTFETSCASRWHSDLMRNDGYHDIYGWDELATRFQRISARGRRDEAHFFRHGATKYNEHNRISGQHNTVLSALGRSQAAEMRKSLPPSIDLILCSGLERTIETMTLCVPKPVLHKAWLGIDNRLNEVNLGVLQGRRRTWVPQFEQGDLDFAPEKGESYRDAARRVLSVIVDIFDMLAETGDTPRTAVIFCHAGVLRIISTLSTSVHSNEVFRTNPANGECLALPVNQVRLPTYWNRTNDRHGAEECYPI